MADWSPISTETFDIPVHEVRRGYRSDAYFWRAKVALERANLKRDVLMQVFQRKDAVLCGIDETLAILKLCTGYYRDPPHAYALFDRYIALKRSIRELYYSAREKVIAAQKDKLDLEAELDAEWVATASDLRVRTLRDGAAIGPWETAMTIEGPLHEFAHLETLYLGVLARRTKIATNVRRVVEAARGKPVFYFPARFDHWAVQGGDGYAASIGGVDSVSTDAQGEWWGQRGAGTIPHCLIAACEGDTIQAAEIFAQSFPEANLIALVDFHNDCVNTSLAVAEDLGERLWGVRLDTSGTLVDQSVVPEMGSFVPTGVNPHLVWAVRNALDAAGHKHVRIIVSGGFDAAKIARFEAESVPADIYGVGSSLVIGNHDFTADVVMVDGKPCSKKGRSFNDNPQLDEVVL